MKKILDIGGIPTSLGEIINIKFHIDTIKQHYEQIKLSFHKPLWNESLHVEAPDWAQKKLLWEKYLKDIGQLFFSEPPYILEESSAKYGGDVGVLTHKYNIKPQKTEIGNLLCKGTSLNIGEYIVITTKARQLERHIFAPLSVQMWAVLKELSKKYKIVVLGERKVEMRKEYGNNTNIVFGIYDDIICNLPKDSIVDLTVPALGETVSDLSQIQQDCLIMKEAKFVITVGVGGNFCLSTSVANMAIGFRTDKLTFTDDIFNKEYPNAIITKDWARFIQALKSYL